MTILTVTVYCTLRFIGFHRWKDAPEEFAHLRSRHRHEFHVRVDVLVEHDDREVEFQLLKHDVRKLIEKAQAATPNSVEEWSCESWALYLLEAVPYCVRVEVSEDGENGAVASRHS
jgi:6-pyruvoyl-tetrahydropterin synthase